MARYRIMLALAAFLTVSGCGDRELVAPTPSAWGPPAAAVLEAGTIVQLSGLCALKTDATLVCWGYAQGAQPLPPVGLREVSVSTTFGCGITLADSLVCWGQGDYGVTSPPPGRFAHLSVEGFHGCAVALDGSLACWGDNRQGEATPPQGRFTQVDAGVGFTCALNSAAAIVCWGSNTGGQSTPPDGQFTQVTAGVEHACAVRTDGTAACWGTPSSDNGQTTPPSGAFVQISASKYTCGIRPDGSVACWGMRAPLCGPHGCETPPIPVPMRPAGGGFVQVVAASDYACGLTTFGKISCWGYPAAAMSIPPAGRVTQVSAGDRVCFLRADGVASCVEVGYVNVGDPYNKPDPARGYGSTEAGGSFVQVSVGKVHYCAVQADSKVYCWGNDIPSGLYPRYNVAFFGRFVQVSSGTPYSCAIRSDYHLICFGGVSYGASRGWEAYSEFERPGLYRQVAVGDTVTCAIKVDNTIGCFPQSPAIPSGTFTQLSVAVPSAPSAGIFGLPNGPNYCGIRTDGTLACWNSATNIAPPPAGTFTRVSVGSEHACALRGDSTLACWGKNRYGETTAPAGKFIDVAAGRSFSCGVMVDHTYTCWGGYRISETPIPVNHPPVALAGGPYAGYEGTAVALALTGSDPDGDALAYSWDFGDGATGAGSVPPGSHAYADNGTYTIRLTVSDGQGGEATATTTATIANVAPTIPVAGFTGPATPLRMAGGIADATMVLHFTDPAGSFDTYSAAIACGNGTSLTPTGITSPYQGVCRYTRPGIYTMSATVSDEDGGTSAPAQYQYVLVYDPAGSFVTGGGWLAAPANACPTLCNARDASKAHFTVEAKFSSDGAQAPHGAITFWLQGKKSLDVRTSSLTMMIAWDNHVQLWGPATMNGTPNYTIRLSGLDQSKDDLLRIELFDPTGARVYDTQWGASRDAVPATPVQGGQLTVHGK